MVMPTCRSRSFSRGSCRAFAALIISAALPCHGITSDEVRVLGFGALDDPSSFGRGSLIGPLSIEMFHTAPMQVVGLRDFHKADLLPKKIDSNHRGAAPMKKISLILRALDAIPDDDFVLFLDATDAFAVQPVHRVLDKYSSLLRERCMSGQCFSEGQEPVLMSGLSFCYPFQEWSMDAHRVQASDYRPDHLYRVSEGSPLLRLNGSETCKAYRARFLKQDGHRTYPEPGMFFGRVRSLTTLLQKVMSLAAEEGDGTDQPMFLLARLHRPDLLIVDGRWNVFASPELEVHPGHVYNKKGDSIMTVEHPEFVRMMDAVEAMRRLKYENNPVIIHMPGPAKIGLRRIFDMVAQSPQAAQLCARNPSCGSKELLLFFSIYDVERRSYLDFMLPLRSDKAYATSRWMGRPNDYVCTSAALKTNRTGVLMLKQCRQLRRHLQKGAKRVPLEVSVREGEHFCAGICEGRWDYPARLWRS
eukprot:TRINITY_DN65109_c0_g1_i1.p1 TRINITY_DN65109_c0_g1~~TRINITY_DN65109_c0_g1_i1.p1  ORF type:complete len:473 (+),score=40.39 TRINITY_DN65109_c0_g1_i1:166-1584(+)